MNEIDALDRALTRSGTDIVLRRYVDSVKKDVTVRALIRSWQLRDEEFVASGSTAQEDLLVTISPTPLAANLWPGGTGSATDPVMPVKGDKLVVRGRERNIEVVDPIKIGDAVVRINMRALG